jgi:hypothetical protein
MKAINILLGDAVKLNEIMEFENSMLIGRFPSRHMGETLLKSWTEGTFGTLLGYIP